MKNGALLFLLMVALCLLPATAKAQKLGYASTWVGEGRSHALYEKLIFLEQEQNYEGIFTEINNLVFVPPADTVKIYASLVFLTERTFGLQDLHEMNLGYLLLYTDMYYLLAQLTKEKPAIQKIFLQNAVAGVMTFETLGMLDNLRCADPVSWRTIKTQLLMPRLEKIAPAYAAYEPEEFKAFAVTVLKLESDLLNRPPNPQYCNPPAEGMSAEDMFIDSYTWGTFRAEASEILQGFWKSRYEEATQVSLD